MIIQVDRLRVRNFKYGFRVEKRKGSRWVSQTFHKNLSQAVQSLAEETIAYETRKYTVCAPDLDSAQVCTRKIVETIDRVADRIEQAIKEAE